MCVCLVGCLFVCLFVKQCIYQTTKTIQFMLSSPFQSYTSDVRPNHPTNTLTQLTHFHPTSHPGPFHWLCSAGADVAGAASANQGVDPERVSQGRLDGKEAHDSGGKRQQAGPDGGQGWAGLARAVVPGQLFLTLSISCACQVI